MKIILPKHIWRAIPLIANCYYTMCDWRHSYFIYRREFNSEAFENAITNSFNDHAELDLPMVYQILWQICVYVRIAKVKTNIQTNSFTFRILYKNVISLSYNLWFLADEFISKHIQMFTW